MKAQFWSILLASVAAMLVMNVVSCGIKSPPKPPAAVRPERITTLRSAMSPEGVRLTWDRPERYAGGSTMRDLSAFVLERAAGDGEFEPLEKIAVTDRERFQRQKRFAYVDATAVVGRFYRYQVRALTADGYLSLPSNEVTLTRTLPAVRSFALPTPSMPK